MNGVSHRFDNTCAKVLCVMGMVFDLVGAAIFEVLNHLGISRVWRKVWGLREEEKAWQWKGLARS